MPLDTDGMPCPLCGGKTVLTSSRANGTQRQRACLSEPCGFTFQTQEVLTVSSVGYAKAVRAAKAREYLRAAGVLE